MKNYKENLLIFGFILNIAILICIAIFNKNEFLFDFLKSWWFLSFGWICGVATK